MKKLKGNTVLAIGILIFSISLLLRDVIDEKIFDFIGGVGVGIELAGFYKMCKEKRS